MTHIATNETIAATKAKTFAYLASLTAVPFEYDMDKVESIAPSEMQIGDHMLQHNCVYKIEEIKVYPPQWGHDIPCYVALGTYVSGDISMYKCFLASAENGCASDHRTSQQGNSRATWLRVKA